jgi:ribulose-5-phosphate 4-epimerase/fuculose-1-phosphate aldolase
LYQTRGAARAVVHLHSTHSVALSMLPEIDPRAALAANDGVLPDEVRLDRAGAVLSAGDPAVADAIKGLAGKYSSVLLANHGPVVSGDSLEAAVFAIEELEETAKLYLLLRGLNPRFLTPAQVGGSVKDVWADAAGARARLASHRHGRARPGHPRALRHMKEESKAWMPGSSPA